MYPLFPTFDLYSVDLCFSSEKTDRLPEHYHVLELCSSDGNIIVITILNTYECKLSFVV